MHFPISLTALALLAGSVWADMDPMASVSMAATDIDTMSMSKSVSVMLMATTSLKPTTMSTTSAISKSTSASLSTSIVVLVPTTSKSSTTSLATVTVSKPTTALTTSSTMSKPTTALITSSTMSKPTMTMTTSSTLSKPTMILGTGISITTKVLLQTGMTTTTKPTSMVLATGVTSKSTSTSIVLMATLSSKTTVPAAMATAKVVTHVVKVSTLDNTLSFVPNSLVAAPGSLVQFQFFPMNHSVVQAAFTNPCVPINSVQPAVKGIFSGFMPTNGVITPIFTILINDTQPIWYYCSQAMHCQAGMVGVINPATTQSITQFAAAAKLATTNITPGTAAPIVPMNPMAPAAPKLNTTILPSAMPPMSTVKPGNVSATVPGIVRQTANAAAGLSVFSGAGVAGILAAIGMLAL